MNSISDVTEQLTPDEEIQDEAKMVVKKFIKLNKYFSKIHKSISGSNVVTEEELQRVDNIIRKYMDFFRYYFSDTRIILKQHLLENHCINWVRKWKFGFGFHGEQGAESIHRKFNRYESCFGAIESEVNKLKSMMVQHYTGVAPELKSLVNK
jgi:hypothetical protein